LISLLAFGFGATYSCLAGQAKKWADVPEPVRATILANGGKVGSVDKEGFKVKGMVVYEAEGKDKKGQVVDLEITEDGKLVQMKDDASADRTKEDAAKLKTWLASSKFTHPREIRSEEHTSELQSPCNLVCRLLLEKKKLQHRILILLRPRHLHVPLQPVRHRFHSPRGPVYPHDLGSPHRPADHPPGHRLGLAHRGV